ncbi:hypothetical protein H9P43_004978 [Blastocladiella emersonii ATCC 22665]|nr:hypothetical protein H9P43_004978 [Blastocladiella emersonii ATCC 22665]
MAELEVISNSVSQIDRTPDGLHYAFIRLDASGKSLTSVDPLADFPHLRVIDLSGNALTTLNRGLAIQKYLLSLNTSGNKLTAVEDQVFGSKAYLSYLDLSSNEIATCATRAWPALVTLNFNKNQLAELELAHTPELTQCEARENKLVKVLIEEAPKLKRLYLAANQITELDFLKNKEALETLHLRDNAIATLLPFAESNLVKLTYLNLRKNNIANFDEIDHLKPLKSLLRLNLQENPICEQESYRLNVIYRLPQVQILDKEPIAADEREEGEQVRVQNERAREELAAQQKAQAEAEAAALASEALAEQRDLARSRGGDGSGDGGGDDAAAEDA